MYQTSLQKVAFSGTANQLYYYSYCYYYKMSENSPGAAVVTTVKMSLQMSDQQSKTQMFSLL